MRKQISRVLALFVASLGVFTTGCQVAQGNTHTHSFTKKVAEEQYLKSEADCTNATLYYYSCECGEAGEKTFSQGKKLAHDYSGEVQAEEYLKQAATCQDGAVYFKSCVLCGAKSYQTFTAEGVGDHTYTEEVAEGKYIKDEATEMSSAVYYKSCVCGAVGDEETFSYGDPLREYSDAEKALYKPTSLTLTLYDPAESVYGITYNTQQKPLRPVIRVAEGDSLERYEEYSASVMQASSYQANGNLMTYYIVKAEIDLEPEKTYTYQAYDKYVDVGTEVATLQTKNTSDDTITFAHFSDSQSTEGMGLALMRVLSSLSEETDFIVHTGDVVEDSKYEHEWTNMLDNSFAYLSKFPMMAISGNHETTYKNGSNETFKHFNHQIPEQETELGYYYSFTYGNAKFIMLNTNRLTGTKLTDDQYNWLVGELENNDATWTIVSMHNPMYSVGKYGSDPEKNSISRGLRLQLQSLFAQHGVDIVLQGHDHVVSRTYPINKNGAPTREVWETHNGVSYSMDPDGVLYIMNGATGTQTRSPDTNMEAAYYEYFAGTETCSWGEFVINGNSLTVSVKHWTNDGVEVSYTWGVMKTV